MPQPEKLDINEVPTRSISREEILALRKQRRTESKQEKEASLNTLTNELFNQLINSLSQRDFKIEKSNLTLQKIRFYILKHQDNNLDINTLADAITESPHCISDPDCGIQGLLNTHEMKTLQRIAETRRRKAEQTGNEEFNPYEALFQTQSGEYYMARLLNMPHLEEESSFMNHCVGTSDSYINRMKKGEIEILSFRDTKTHEPIATIEYDVKRKIILQIRKKDNEYIYEIDPFFKDLVESLSKLKQTKTDAGETRDFKKIIFSEIQEINTPDYHLYTEKGLVHFEEYSEKEHGFILKKGPMTIDVSTSKDLAVKVLKFELDIEFNPDQIAQNANEVSENTKVYIGVWNVDTYKHVKQFPNITHLYEEFPNKKIFLKTIETNTDIDSPQKASEEFKTKDIQTTDYSEDILNKTEFSKEQKQYKLVSFSVSQLGLRSIVNTKEIYDKALSLGLKLCPTEVGPHLRLNYTNQPIDEILLIATDFIIDSNGGSNLLELNADTDDLWLLACIAYPETNWHGDALWVFLQED